MGVDLLILFAVGGGIPPATSELLRIYEDGTAVSLVGNAWPEGDPQDEIGLYRMKLSPSGLQSIKDFLSEHRIFDMDEKYGPIAMDSGSDVLRLYEGDREKKIKWGPFAKVPSPLKELRTRLRRILQDTRQHPVQTVKVSLQVVHEILKAGQTFRVEFQINNRGSNPIRVSMSGEREAEPTPFRLYAATTEEASERLPPPLNFYHNAQHISSVEPADHRMLNGPLELSPGEEWRVRAMAPFTLERPGTFRLYGFVQPMIEVILDEKPLIIEECFIVTQPITVVVEG